MCTQVTRRYYDPTGLEFWQMQDTLTTRLSFFERKESYQLVMINNRSTTQSYESLGGATSTGEFGSMLQEVFEAKTEATFQWQRWATLRGHRAHVYSYRVPQPNSQWHLSYERSHEVIVGYTGLIYVDRDTGMILKMTLEAENVPPSFPISQASSAVDYDYMKIGEQTHLLPLKAEVRMRSARCSPGIWWSFICIASSAPIRRLRSRRRKRCPRTRPRNRRRNSEYAWGWRGPVACAWREAQATGPRTIEITAS